MSTKEAFSRGIEAAWHGLHESAAQLLTTDKTASDAARFEAYLDVVMAMTGRTRESVLHRVAKRIHDRTIERIA